MRLDETYSDGRLIQIVLVLLSWRSTSSEKAAIISRLDEIIANPKIDPAVRAEAQRLKPIAGAEPTGSGESPPDSRDAVLLKAPDGSVWKVAVDSTGTLTRAKVWSP